MTKFLEFMNERGLSQYRLSKLTGFTKGQISEWMHGIHRPSLRSAQRLAITLQMSLQSLKSQIELRERTQNVRTPDGAFVPRSRKNSPTIVESSDSGRTLSPYCSICGQKLGKAA